MPEAALTGSYTIHRRDGRVENIGDYTGNDLENMVMVLLRTLSLSVSPPMKTAMLVGVSRRTAKIIERPQMNASRLYR
jgi:hypothetical protein